MPSLTVFSTVSSFPVERMGQSVFSQGSFYWGKKAHWGEFWPVTLVTLTLKVPIATKVVCFSRLLKYLRSLYEKQCGPTSDCSSDQTASMRRLVWVFAGRTYHIVGNLMSQLKCCLFCHLLRCFRIIFEKQYGFRSDCSCKSSLIWVHTVCLYTDISQ